MAAPGDLLLITRPSAPTLEELVAAVDPLDLRTRLGSTLVPTPNLHQSLSEIYPPDMRQQLLEASSSIRAHAFVMHIDRIRSSGTLPGSIHWELFPSAGKPEGLSQLLEAREATFQAYGIRDTLGHSAHLTTSYFAREMLGAPMRFAPVPWVIDAIELVKVCGSGRNYRYETIAKWSLLPMLYTAPAQLSLIAP